MSMINALKPEHLFCVGDPRQSIYGWRGSRIKYITEFDTYYENPTVITLQTNYRSDKAIINLANTVIEPMLLPPLEPHSDAEGTVTHTYHTNKHDEKDHVRRIIKNQPKPVYVLARRNKQLQDLSDHLDKHGIKHELKRDQDEEAKQDVLLATIHASKGLEAPTVVLLSANARNHPLQVSEHPVIETLQPDTYDRDAEERRLLYVALTRAQRELHVTYTGKRSKYLPYSQKQRQKQESQKQSKTLEEALKAWRKKQSKAGRVPEFKVLPNSALRAVLDDEPVSEEELRGIWGFTSKRIKKYGSEIISIVRDYA
jgi:superfamily I DNA/RNA helicase